MDDMADNDTFEHTLAGRTMVFLKGDPGQVIMLRRYVGVQQEKLVLAQKTKDAAGIAAVMQNINDAVWTAVESRFTSTEDISFVQLQIIAGKLKDKDLLPLLHNGSGEDTRPDDAPPVKKTVKKAAKKAAPVQKNSGLNRRAR